MLFLFVLLATALSSCKSTSAVLPTATTDSTSTKLVTTKIHDTIFKTEKDSSYYKAYLECVNGKVVVSQKFKVESHKGNYLEAPKVQLQDNILKVDCRAEAQALYAKWIDKYTLEHQQITKNIPYAVPLDLSWWQKTQIWAGRLLLLIVFFVLIGAGLRASKII